MSSRWQVERLHLHPLGGRPPYPYVDEELRKVARDAYVSWQGSRYSVPWTFAGKQVWVRNRGSIVEVLHGRDRIAVHHQATHKHTVITEPGHHGGIPLSARQERKTLIHIQDTAPVVEARSLAAYESAAFGAMIPTYTAKPGRRYRYYVCRSARRNGWNACGTKSVSAKLIEGSVIDHAPICGMVRGSRHRLAYPGY